VLPITLKWSDAYSSRCALHVLVTQFGKPVAAHRFTLRKGGSWQTVKVPWGRLTGHFTVTLKFRDAVGKRAVASASVVASR